MAFSHHFVNIIMGMTEVIQKAESNLKTVFPFFFDFIINNVKAHFGKHEKIMSELFKA